MENDDEGYDAVVVGSGYGGAVAACRMSVAGIKVCLIEKGRRWEAQDFPSNVLSLLSTVKWSRPGISLGSDKALFQMHEEDDSIAVVACGLGGGSLVNAGVLLPTPVRARRDLKWPTEWNKDWEKYENLASSMLGAQYSPVEFSNGRITKQILCEEIEDYKPDPIKFSINFDRKEGEEDGYRFAGTKKLESCLACGNCLSGCPYNAKNSTDKNYLALAIEAGCTVKTERKVQYVVKNSSGVHWERRWRLYFDDLEYVSADFVVLSAGVLGTAEILFRSQRRGMGLSERLGHGLSCNGNNVAYVARSKAPLHAYGLKKDEFSDVPFHVRPGPAISSSFTSSAGFTIQGGVLPNSYPDLLFKGITTYGWPPCYWFLNGFFDKLKCYIMGSKASQAMILNVMGHDACDGTITFDDESEKLRITPPHDSLLPKKILAFQKLTRKLGGILFMSRYRSTSVHLLGGCNAATNATLGVCNPKGQVFNPTSTNQLVLHEGLYVSDASLIPCSIGVNPCLTITALSERISWSLVADVLKYKSIVQAKEANKTMYSAPKTDKMHDNLSKDKVVVKETMRGFIGGMPCTAYLTMNMNYGGKESFGDKNSVIGDSHSLLRGRVGGYVVFKCVSKDKLFILDGEVDLCQVDSRTSYTQCMHYGLILGSSSGSRYILEGKKVMNPFFLALYAWHESRTLHATFRKVETNDVKDHTQHNSSSEEVLDLHGELSISAFELLKSAVRLKGKQRGKFICLLLQSLWRTYILQVPRYIIEEDFKSSEVDQIHYPPYILHNLKTEDGYIITCKQWRGISTREGRRQYPVLLLNGYSGESYWLPTERRDLVRVLVEEGYDIWLLHYRLHPLHPSNNFTIEDIGKFDIPAVISKIFEVNGPLSRIHVIAHCVGGLAIHIALLGGHVSSSKIASLSCTNTSMFFKLNTYALVKMKLPLLPVTMCVLGRNTTLSLTDSSNDEFRHSLLKSIARTIPRTERCTSDECEIFSGVFGNAFLHSNISKTLHQWLVKQNITHLPMSGFPHLQKICKAGFVVDAEGKNKYLMHTERMALPTLYISSGKPLLVRQETSMLAYKYMRLHQPEFEHRRVVVEGFGHSDLLIGEESYKCVFPHFLSHMKMAEGGGRRKMTEKSVVSWEDSVVDNEGLWASAFFIFLLAFFMLLGAYLILVRF